MSINGFDEEILKDFLTESSELLEQLEADLVVLEGTPRDLELINRVFRALHTIKGSASFLALTNLVRIAHAAEGALNAARNQVIVVDAPMMNLLLEAADVIKGHLGQLTEGNSLSEPRAELVAKLSALAEGQGAGQGGGASDGHVGSGTQGAAQQAGAGASQALGATQDGPRVRPLQLGSGKTDLFEFLVSDLDETLAKVQQGIASLASDVQAQNAALGEQCEQLARAVEFFECEQMSELARLVGEAAGKMPTGSARGQVLPAMQRIMQMLQEQAAGIKVKEVRELSVQEAVHALEDALEGKSADVVAAGQVVVASEQSAQDAPTPASDVSAVGSAAGAAPASGPASGPGSGQGAGQAASVPAQAKDEGEKKASVGENTIRVEVSRLEALMNLVGELVLQKNRVFALSRKLAMHGAGSGRSASEIEGKAGQVGAESAELTEAMAMAAGSLDRVTSDIQVAVMRTRMQPVDKLFGRYPRLIRDLANKTGKKISLVIEGGETEVDKSVIEELGDPLVHMLRNSCDHGLEGPEERVRAGKNDTGTITIRASHEGSHVRIVIADDGRGLNRERIAKKAIERGLFSSEQIQAMSDHEVYQIIFEPGFSTAEKVSDLSGRGVGMDVVRTNIQKLKGSIALSSVPGKGTTLNITIPLTVAILHAMMVAVGSEIYAVPLSGILEIVRPADMHTSTIGGHPVMQLRDSLLPLINGARLFDHPDGASVQTPFAVVLHMGDKRVGLLVTRLIGQQEVVVKPLDDSLAHGRRAVSGATVRDDGGVSLIVDIAELVRMAQAMPAASAA
jgi:two-component system chemotaxis sensor kinase CheA